MFRDPSDPYKQPAKLVLPDAPTEEYHPPEYFARPFQAGRLIDKNQTSAAPPAGSLYKRLTTLWHRDPAYKMLFVAIGFVLVASIVSIAILATLATQISSSIAPTANLSTRPQPIPTIAVLPTPQATAAPTPIPTPIPTPTPVAVLTPTSIATAPAIIQPTANPDQELVAQIGALPAQISNGTMVPVTVSTNQPGATVSLFVTYSAIPILYTSGPQIADASGRTTFSLSVHERTFSPFTRMIAANITAIVHYQGRRQATSKTATIHILTR